jgi:hypothetical protein
VDGTVLHLSALSVPESEPPALFGASAHEQEAHVNMIMISASGNTPFLHDRLKQRQEESMKDEG